MRVVHIDVDVLVGEQLPKPFAHGSVIFSPTGAARCGQVEALGRQPSQPFEHGCPAARAALGFVLWLRVMVDRHANFKLVTVALLQFQQGLGTLFHGAHGVGQHQGAKTSGQRVFQHGQKVRVHERLSAGEADFFGAELLALNLVQVAGHLRSRQIDQRVIAGCGFDVAIDAGQVAQRAGVKPERPQGDGIDPGAGFALGRAQWIAELQRVFRATVH